MGITLADAITDLQSRVDGEFTIKAIDYCEDMKLGIEAIKRIDRQRKLAIPIYQPPLPGETIV